MNFSNLSDFLFLSSALHPHSLKNIKIAIFKCSSQTTKQLLNRARHKRCFKSNTIFFWQPDAPLIILTWYWTPIRQTLVNKEMWNRFKNYTKDSLLWLLFIVAVYSCNLCSFLDITLYLWKNYHCHRKCSSVSGGGLQKGSFSSQRRYFIQREVSRW